MLRRRLPSAAILCLLASTLAVSACGGDEDSASAGKSAQESPEEAIREGLFTDIGGLDYNVYLTRQLNPKDVEDRAYFEGPEPPPGSALYGVFLRVCNEGDEPLSSAADFKIRDTQDGEYEPLELPEDNAFAYRPSRIEAKSCFPQDGSVAALGPTGAALLVFQLPSVATENRPLELEIRAPLDATSGEQPERAIELDV